MLEEYSTRQGRLESSPAFSKEETSIDDDDTVVVVTIEKEGSVPKFVKNVRSLSFSAKRAIKNGQKVLYVTERCVFRLTPKGLKLIETYPGIDPENDVIRRLPFEVET